MSSVSAEALLISALINTESVGEEISYGICLEDFEGYRDEYNWLIAYVATYDCQPTEAIFRYKFPSFWLVDHHDVRSAAQMVHDASSRRRINTAMSEAVDLLHINNVDGAYQTLCAAQPRNASAQPRNLLTDPRHLDDWDSRPYAVEVPYPTLQRFTNGIRAGNLWYVAARPGQGKSAHLVSMAKRAVMDGNRVLFYSLEMSESEVRARFHAALASDLGFSAITVNNLYDRHVDRQMYREFHDRLAERLTEGTLDVHTPADGPVSPSVVAARASEYDLTIIDYVGLMAQDGGGAAVDDWRVMAKISNTLKTIALAQKTGIVCAAQINRDGETGSAPPRVKNLAQSDALGQDGDVVLTMRAKPKNVATHFSLEKNRHGPSGIHFYTTFDPNRGVFTEISGDHAEDLVLNAEALAGQTAPPQLRVIKSKDEL